MYAPTFLFSLFITNLCLSSFPFFSMLAFTIYILSTSYYCISLFFILLQLYPTFTSFLFFTFSYYNPPLFPSVSPGTRPRKPSLAWTNMLTWMQQSRPSSVKRHVWVSLRRSSGLRNIRGTYSDGWGAKPAMSRTCKMGVVEVRWDVVRWDVV